MDVVEELRGVDLHRLQESQYQNDRRPCRCVFDPADVRTCNAGIACQSRLCRSPTSVVLHSIPEHLRIGLVHPRLVPKRGRWRTTAVCAPQRRKFGPQEKIARLQFQRLQHIHQEVESQNCPALLDIAEVTAIQACDIGKR